MITYKRDGSGSRYADAPGLDSDALLKAKL